MAMLAEPRSRQKWSADPRNTTWSNDKSKFGYQLMTKMGWSEGKGLGANLSGETKHIAARKKKGQHGVGATAGTDDNWIAHQDDFNALLGALNQGLPCPEAPADDAISRKIASLESTVKRSSKKIMYKKYVQGKDLSRASANDLASIFGQRNKSAPSTPQLSGDEDGNENDEISDSDPDQGMKTITSNMDMNEYFAIKMEAYKERREAKRKEERLAKERGECFVEANNNNEKKVTLYLDNDPCSETTLEPKKKKRKADPEEEAITPETPNEVATTHDSTEKGEQPAKRKKKKKKKQSTVEEEQHNEIPAATSDGDGSRELKKNNKKNKNKDSIELEVSEQVTADIQADLGSDSPVTTSGIIDSSEIKKKKKKKKKKHRDDEDENNVVAVDEQANTDSKIVNTAVEVGEPTDLKKKKKERKHADTEKQPVNEMIEPVVGTEEQPPLKKKKKKRKKAEAVEE